MNKVCLISVLICLCFGFAVESKLEDRGIENLNESFNNLNINKDMYNINGKVNINNKFMEIEDLNVFLQDICKELKLSEKNNELMVKNEKYFKQLYLHNHEENISIIVCSEKYNAKTTTYIIVDINKNQVYNNIVDDFYRLKNVLLKHNKNPEIYSCLVGYFDGKMNNQSQNHIIKKTFSTLKANQLEKIENEKIISVTGYTSNINNYITYSGYKANVNMSFVYNENKNRTYLYMATPLITLEY